MYNPGRYKTVNGAMALVVQVRQDRRQNWHLAGVIIGSNGVLYIHYWELDGKSRSPNADWDLR